MDRRIERTRTAVVEAAVALAARGGPGLGMTEIATAAGVSRKAVYENFGSRDEVLRSATRWLLRDAVPEPASPGVAASADSENDGAATGERSAWSAVLGPVVAHMTRHRDYYRSALSGPASAAARDAVVEHAVTELRAERERRREPVEDGPEGAGRRRDRFVVHGLVATLADALLQRPDADLAGLCHELCRGLTDPAPCC